MPEQLTPQLGAEYLNELVEYEVKVFRDTVRMILTNYMQDGHLPFTFPLKAKEQAAYLASPEAVQQAQTMVMDQDAATRAQGVELWTEIQEAQDGQQATA